MTEEMKKNKFAECDLTEMAALLPVPKDVEDAFFEHWDVLIADSPICELLDAIEHIQSIPDKGYAFKKERIDEILEEVKAREPFNSLDERFDSHIKLIQSVERDLKDEFNATSRVGNKFENYITELVSGIVMFLKAKYPDDREMLDFIKRIAAEISGY